MNLFTRDIQAGVFVIRDYEARLVTKVGVARTTDKSGRGNRLAIAARGRKALAKTTRMAD